MSLRSMLMLTVFALVSCATSGSQAAKAAPADLEAVKYVDLKKYLGKWYEIASFPQDFQKGCVATSATYSLRKDGDIDVLNECRLGSFDGKLKSAQGKAKVADRKTNAKLNVTFFWPFYGKYWIIELGEKYDYAVVGHPNRKYLWILSRSSKMSEAQLAAIVARVKEKGFDVSLLQTTAHP